VGKNMKDGKKKKNKNVKLKGKNIRDQRKGKNKSK
jgi:hypothetical protein